MDKKEKTFEVIANEWMSIRECMVKKTTANRYRKILDNHLIPQFGNKKIFDLDNERLKVYMKGLEGKLKYYTIEGIFNVLKNVLNYAGIASVFKFKELKIVKDSEEIDTLTEEECKAINNSLKSSFNLNDLGILLALNTGIRVGEVCGIRWEDINLKKKSILIKHTVQRVSTNAKNGPKTKVELLTPKTSNSMREIAIPNLICSILEDIEPSICDKHVFLISNTVDKLIEPRTLERQFEKRCKEIVGRNIKFHNLRHTYASLSISLGVDAKIVSEMLGHGNVLTTLQFYRKVGFNEKSKGVRVLENAIGA